MDINHLLVQDQYEDDTHFNKRKEFTLKIAEYNVNPMTAIVLGRMMMNKINLNVTYEQDVEDFLSKIEHL